MTETITLTREQALALKPCDKGRVPKMARGQAMNAAEALAAGVSIDDLLWVADRLGRKDLCVRFALACAQRVAHLNPDPRVQAALDATQAWLDNPTDAAAAGAAGAAGDAAWAAYAAAARAAGAAGDAAWAAAWAAEQQAARAIFLEIFG
jgi:hypothetical protein